MDDLITNSVLNSYCFAWHPYGKLELFKTESVIDDACVAIYIATTLMKLFETNESKIYPI